MPLTAFLAGLLLAAGSALLPAAGLPAAHAATPDPDDAVSITVAPAASPTVVPGQDLRVTVTISNETTADIAAGATMGVYLAQRALATRSGLDSWLSPDAAGRPGDLLLSEPLTVAIPQGNTVTRELTVPAAAIGLTSQNRWGARGIAATLTVGGEVQAQGRGTFVWYPPATVTPVQLATILPVTTPAGTTGLIPANELETYTGPDGLLTRQLDQVSGRPAALAIDPMIIASIRILGSAAPPAAVAWLERLDAVPNDIFPLSYADADIALQSHAGADILLAPLSFDHVIDPALFAAPPATDEQPPEATGPPAGATETPAPTPADGTPPTSAELLAWDYTSTAIGWPSAGTVTAADLGVFAASGLTTTILAGSNAEQTDGNSTPNTGVALEGGGLGLVTDDALQRAIRTASAATTDAEWRAAVAEASSILAVVAAERPGSPRTLLATFDRGGPAATARLGQTLDALAALPWHSGVTLQEAVAATPAPNVAFEARTEPDDRTVLARELLEREAEVTAFSDALSDPLSVTAAQRLEVLALLALSWTHTPGSWPDAVAASLAASTDLMRSITVTTRGPINVYANKVDIPVTLSNALTQAVTVRVQVVPSNGRLIVGDAIESTIDAESARTVKVPVSAAVGNGGVMLRVSLSTPDGTAINEPTLIPVNVQAEWEGLGALIFAVLVIAFFGFGVWRNISRRRREHKAAVAEATERADAPTTAPEEQRG